MKTVLGLFLIAQLSPCATRNFDVVVYGATAGGVVAAVSAAREGASVVLLEPGAHIGGMTSGGLGRTDFGRKEVIGGYSLEFYQRLGKHYGEPVTWFFEPHVAEKVLRDWLAESKVTVLHGRRLKQKRGVTTGNGNIVRIDMENGDSFTGKVFMDCTYEGDLLAGAGVSFTVGREGVSQYGESLAGVRPKDRNHQFDLPVKARDEKGRLLPEIQAEPRGEIGSADKRVQAYNFRLCLTTDPANQVEFPKPPGYDPRRFAVLARLIEALTTAKGRVPTFNELAIVSPMPNQKTDVNNRGAFSTDYIGKNYDYPTASYKRREAIWRDHIEYTQGLLFFLANDPQVPESLRKDVRRYGLAKDEFADTKHWPHQLYVREARRMVGDFVMTQKDIQTDLTKADAIGMGSYNSDSHNVQRYEQADGTVQNEGNMEVRVEPYDIPYRVLLPKRSEIRNLLVPVCMSSSHVAYSTLRMEPQYMILGHAAGVAAKMMIDSNVTAHEVDMQQLQRRLMTQGLITTKNVASRQVSR